MSFSTMMAQASVSDAVDILPSWGQGRATFGGVIAALLYQHVHNVVASEQPLRSLTMSFVAPVTVGAVTLESRVVRRGKSVIQAESRMLQHGEVVALMLASFGASRASTVIVAPDVAPVFKTPEASVPLPYIPNVVPEFTRHFDLHWAVGSLPFSANHSSTMGGWVRFNAETGQSQISHLLALVDSWPPSVLQMFNIIAPISTLTWTIEFLANTIDSEISDWWQYLAEADASSDGYAHIGAKLWSKSGQLVAISRQTVAVFA